MKYIKTFNENSLSEYDVENIIKIKGDEIVSIENGRELTIVTKSKRFLINCSGGETVDYDGIYNFDGEIVADVKFTEYTIELKLSNGDTLFICDPTNGEGLEVSIELL